MRRAATIATAAIAAAVSAPAVAGTLDGAQIDNSLSYRPAGCAAPAEPTYAGISNGTQAYNAAVEGYLAYVEKAKAYVACVEAEAQSDLDMLHQAVVRGAGARVNDAQAAIDRGKVMLDAAADDIAASGR